LLAGIPIPAIQFLPRIVSFLVIGIPAGPPGFGLNTDESPIETVGKMLTVEPGSFAEGKTFRDLTLSSRFGFTDYGIRKGDTTLFSPDTGLRLAAGDSQILFTSDKNAPEIAGLFSHAQD
jgi:uncharacterized protein with PhoU and TrkA domain